MVFWNFLFACSCTWLVEKARPVRATGADSIPNFPWFQKYLTLDEINAAIDQLAQNHNYRNSVKIETIGYTQENRPIRLVTVSSSAAVSKPGIWIDGGMHPLEWITPATVLFILNRLLTAPYPKLIKGANWYFVPVVNPDGYVYSHENDRFWRKNRRPGPESNRDCAGVDLNRNFDYDFGGADGSDDPCESNYQGPHAFSEPESQAVRRFVETHKNISAYITLHSYGQHWYYPYGNRQGAYPDDVDELSELARKGASALRKAYNTTYQVGTSADLLYESSGAADDWAKGKAGIKYVYTLELRPADTNQSYSKGIKLPPRKIIPTALETWFGLRVIFEEVISKGVNRKRKASNS